MTSSSCSISKRSMVMGNSPAGDLMIKTFPRVEGEALQVDPRFVSQEVDNVAQLQGGAVIEAVSRAI